MHKLNFKQEITKVVSLIHNNFRSAKKASKLRIEQVDEGYEVVKIANIGLTPPLGLEGAIVLRGDYGGEFAMSAFSGEVAKHIAAFRSKNQENLPTVYNMIEQICEESELLLVKVKIYPSGGALCSNLYFVGKKEVILRNFRASDAIALASFYNVPILIRKTLLEQTAKQSK